MLLEARHKCSRTSGYSATPYVAICFAFQVICDACGYLVCQACLRRRRHVRDDRGVSIVQHVAGVDDFESAVATDWAACHRWTEGKDYAAPGSADYSQELGG
jgi:hypothetical protein